MAIVPETQYPGKITPASAEYPYGQARNITLPGDGSGTPWEAALVNDIFGFQQEMLSRAGITPSGDPDHVGDSQYMQALEFIVGAVYGSVAEDLNGLEVLDGKTVEFVSFHPGWAVAATYNPQGGGVFIGQESVNKSDHDGIRIISPTVPTVSDQAGADLNERIANFLAGVGETDPGGTGVFVRADTQDITPEMAGAFGNGTANETAAVRAWWEGGFRRLRARGTYRVENTTAFQFSPTTNVFYADMVGATFDVQAVTNGLFRVDCDAGVSEVFVMGARILGNTNTNRGIQIEGSATIGRIQVSGNRLNDIGETTQAASAIAVQVACSASSVAVFSNRINGVSRVTNNPGVLACVGISVTDIAASCAIFDNVVLQVLAPAGEADADGISVFSLTRLDSPATRQRILVDITGNRVQDCTGRFIKSQATGCRVYANRFESLNADIVTEFRAIDFQFGGGHAFANEWNLGGGITVGTTAMFFRSVVNDTGNWEFVTDIHDNRLILEQDLRYFAFFIANAATSVFQVHSNQVTRFQSTTHLSDFVRLDAPVIADVDSVTLDVHDNRAPVDDGQPLILTPAEWGTDSTYGDKFTLKLKDNEMYGVGSPAANLIAVLGDPPYLQNIQIAGNNGASNRLDAQGVNVNLLPWGNRFYYGTDGGAGGLINAPAGYNRFVHIDFDGRLQRLNSNTGSTFAQRVDGGGTWYEYTGTAL